ncbi:MAG: hypothetical protein ACRYGF_04995 [Janthinobacterium lividum]
MTTFKRTAAALTLAGVLSPLAAMAQQTHAEAKAEQEAKDRHHHTKAKLVGGSAAGGAATGALVGGPVGAVVGAGIGAGGGLIGNKIRKHHGIKKKEHEER